MHSQQKWVTVFLLMLAVFLASAASAQEASFTVLPDSITPGVRTRIAFSLPQADTVSLYLLTSDQYEADTILQNAPVQAGTTSVLYDGAGLGQGHYLLCLEWSGGQITAPLSVGSQIPSILRIQAPDLVYLGDDNVFSVQCDTDGTLAVECAPDGESFWDIASYPVQGGSLSFTWDGSLPGQSLSARDVTLRMVLTDAFGQRSEEALISLHLTVKPTPSPVPSPTPLPVIRPSAVSTETQAGDFWSMEVGVLNWDAIWQVMIAPMTVISGNERVMYYLRATPDSSKERSNILGEITCATQGIHVLENLDNGWSLVETYNSSYGSGNYTNSRGRGYGSTDELIQGYVETAKLTTFTPRTDYGLLIDKMTQKLYILTENGLLTTLNISTGNPTSAQPWNETPSGEYYLSSKVGNFPSGNMTCQYGMRFNDGCLLHEVPYIWNEKYEIKDYSSTERYLGEKASHGCVRVQRKKNDDGYNMLWIWKNVPVKTKLLIWDDSFRPLSYPAEDDTMMYYNPIGGKYYHSDAKCSSVNNRYLPLKGQVTYAMLDSPEYAYLSPCPHCTPPDKKSVIDAYNASIGY